MSEGAQKGSVTNEIVSYMRRMISSGEWKVGSKIPSENQLRSTLSVSRTSLRSAIMQLAALNILKAKQGLGTYVISPINEEGIFEESGKNMVAKKEVIQILEFLKILAPTAVFVEMKKFDKCFNGLDRQLKDSFKKQKALASQDQSLFLQECFNFHCIIFNSLLNEFVKDSIIEAIERLQVALTAFHPSISTQVILTLHYKLLTSITLKEPTKARNVIKKLYDYLTAHDYLRKPQV